jgi:hypothetical protein
MSSDLIRPILQNCSADVLARFELASPVCSRPGNVRVIADLCSYL